MPRDLRAAFAQAGRMDAGWNQGGRWRAPRDPVGWHSPDGNYPGYLNTRFRDWMGVGGVQFWEDFFIYTVKLGTLAAAGTAQTSFQIQADSSFELVAITAQADLANASVIPTQIAIQIADAGSGRNLSNVPVPLGNIAGTGTFLHILPVSRRFVSNSQVNIFAVNNDTASTFTLTEVSLIGRKIFNTKRADLMGRRKQFKTWTGQDGKTYAEDWYTYNFTLASIASAATTPITVVVESDSDFELILMQGGGIRNATTGQLTSAGLIDVQLLDGGAQRNLFSASTAMNNVFGNGSTPFILPITRIFLAKTPITLTLTNIDSVTWNNLTFTLEGRKIFEMS
jgi:hypothetical protein